MRNNVAAELSSGRVLLLFGAFSHPPWQRKACQVAGRLALASLLTATTVLAMRPPSAASQTADTDEGFQRLYELQFEQARASFLSWQETHPEDELGHAWRAATYLFQELYEQGVLTSEFFLDDDRFLQGISGRPNEQRASAFRAAAMKAEELAQQRLSIDSKDLKPSWP